MSLFDDKEQLIQKDAEFLDKFHALIDEVYGSRTNPNEDGIVLETLLAGVAQHHANILLMAGAVTLEEGYRLLGTDADAVNAWLANRLNTLIERAFEVSLLHFNANAPVEVLQERELMRQSLDLDMQAIPTSNTKILAS